MELLCASLTGFFLWLFIHHWSSFARKRAIQNAGLLFLEVKLPCRMRVFNITSILILCLMVFLYLIFIIGLYVKNPFFLNLPIIYLSIEFHIAFFIFAFLLAIEVISRKNSFEIRENGIVSEMSFIAWDRIKFCKWNKSKKKISIRYDYRSFSLKVVPESFDHVTELLSRSVEVRDSYNNVIAGQCNYIRQRNSIYLSILTWTRRFFHFQFDLLTLFLFVLLCASISSWYGIIYQHSRQQDNAIEKLERFHPEIVRSIDVMLLYFSDEKNKPNDEDLIYLKPLSQLQILSLDGAPITDKGLIYLKPLSHLYRLDLMRTKITDKGLEHLESLPQLRELVLFLDNITDDGIIHLKKMKNLEKLYLGGGTKITAKGVEELQKALPNTEIQYSPPQTPSASTAAQ